MTLILGNFEKTLSDVKRSLEVFEFPRKQSLESESSSSSKYEKMSILILSVKTNNRLDPILE